jgi:putative ABC transport system permease protein
MRQLWEQTYPDASFDYFFLREQFEAQDREDRYFGKLLECFTALSIVISCLGLFGLSLLISTKRQKEIGVRKVFGASAAEILTIFVKGYLGTLFISVVIGAPLAYLLMNMWLSNYAYRVEIGFEVVAQALLSLIIIFLVTVSYHTIKSSVKNPVTILRD